MKIPYFIMLLLLVTCKPNPINQDYHSNQKVDLVVDDTVYSFSLYDQEIEPKLDFTYHWYNQNHLQKTQGTYQGKVLDGIYHKKTRNQNLLQQGYFDKGLKEGEWIQWFANGNMASIYSYKNGHKEGKFKEYYPDGKVKSSGNYKDGDLHGEFYHVMQDGSDTVYIYKHGEQLIPEISEPDSLQASKNGLWQHLFGAKENETDSL